MIASSPQPVSTSTPPFATDRAAMVTGVMLVTLGCLTAGLVVSSIYGLLYGSVELPLVQKLVSANTSITTPAGTVQVPAAFLTVSTYAVVSMLLFVVVAVAKHLLTTGASLLKR